MEIKTNMKFEDLSSYLGMSYPNKTKTKFEDLSSHLRLAYPNKTKGTHFGMCPKLSLKRNKTTFIRDDGTVWMAYMDGWFSWMYLKL